MEQEKVWDAIANKWNAFRTHPADEAKEFLKGKKGKILDLGCGSGRNFIEIGGLDFYGVDFSSELLKFAKEKNYVELKKSDIVKIPYKDNFFDCAIFIRVLHCIDSNDKRKKSLNELFRVLKPNAKAVISVWGRSGRIKNKNKLCLVPWSADGKKYFRWTYIYDKNEFENLLKNVGFEIIEIRKDKNIVAIVRKPVQ